MMLRLLYAILLVTAIFAQNSDTETAVDENLNETSAADNGLVDPVVGYVMEPFDKIDKDWFQNPSNSTAADAGSDSNTTESYQLTVDKKNQLFGNATVRLEWEKSVAVQEVEFGWILKNFKPHNVLGATYVSLHYQVLQSQGDETVVISFFDDSQCIEKNGYQSKLCSREENLLEYNIPSRELGPATPGTWNEILFPTEYLDPFIDLSRLRGWKLKVQSTSAGGKLNVLFDQLVFSGGGDLLSAPFHVSFDFSKPKTDPQYESYVTGDFTLNELWRHRYYKSEISSNNTLTTLDATSGTLSVDYTIEQKASWGGFVEFGYVAPGNAYYNMTDASALIVDYNIPRAASIPGRAIFRLLLEDISNCELECDNTTLNHERYYSFHPILDVEADDQEVFIPLVGSTEPSTPFWLTGWAGKAGNSHFNKDHINGYFFELVLDSQLGLGGLVDGRVDFFNFRAVKQASGSSDVVGNNDQCVVEADVHFSVSMPTFIRKEFLGRICCQVCQQDPECLFAMTDGRDCYVASELDPGHVRLPQLASGRSTPRKDVTEQLSFWMDDPKKRGDYCTLCDCKPANNLIDCSGMDLPILPMTFTPEVDFAPQVLDLKGNERLSMVGSSLLPDSFRDSLQKILLPKTLKHLSGDLFEVFPRLSQVHFEEAKGDASMVSSKNFISSSDEFYVDVCCSRGEVIELDSPSNGVQFCDKIFGVPGIDSFYQEYMVYGFQNDVIMTLYESSDFLSEAAETVEKCAEVCTITEDCRYFQYDARVPNVEHECSLFRNVSAPAYRKCCNRDDYADLARTQPGWVSGIPPKTRHEKGAKLALSSQSLVAVEENGYHADYSLTLGATPLRGAVWVEPQVHSATKFDVTIKPKRVVLYDANQTAKVDIFVEGVTERSTLVIENVIQSCDTAFGYSSGIPVYIEVVTMDKMSTAAVAGIVVGFLLALALLVFLQYRHHKKSRKKSDSLWKVAPHELKFDDPPEVLGIGTFGLVLKAEYRGTHVAVKRAVPPLKTKRLRFDYSSAHLDASTKHFDSSVKEIPEDSELEINGYGSTSQGGKTSSRRTSGTFSGSISKNSYSQLKQDFISEIRILSKLRHPSITTVMGGVISKGLEPLLVMELMDHKSLYDLLQNETFELDGELCINILRDISQGIRFLHGADPQIIHGDLKAANILIDRKFRAKIADFGLSKQRLGATGTPYWMAPELLRKESNNSSASDIYSFGIILYEVYSRKDPYKGEDPNIVLQQIASKSTCKRPPTPSGAPAEVQSLMQSCVLDDASCRPTAEEIDNRLRRAGIEQVAPTPTTNRKKSRMSLHDIFPTHIAKALEEGREVEPEERECVTIFFSDIVGFTKLSSTLTPLKVANMLDRLYHKFDNLSQKHDLFKLETIGDAYLCVTNLVKDQPDDHTKRIAEFSIDAIKAANETLVDEDDTTKGFVNIRAGFHSGPIVADVVGRRNRKYTLFGDTINTSSRMESTSKTNRIQCSEASALLLREQAPEISLVSRGSRPIKGKGMMCTFWVNEERENAADVDEVLARRHTAPMDLAMLQFANQVKKELEKEVSADLSQRSKASKTETAPSPPAQPQAKAGRRRSSLLSLGRNMEPNNRRVSFNASPAGADGVENTLISSLDFESGNFEVDKFDGPAIDV